MQTGHWLTAISQRVPSAASRSIFSVRAFGSPLHPSAWCRNWSAIIHSMFGCIVVIARVSFPPGQSANGKNGNGSIHRLRSAAFGRNHNDRI